MPALRARWRDTDDAVLDTAELVTALVDQVAAAPPGYSMAQLSIDGSAPLAFGDLGDTPPTVLSFGARPDGGALRFVDYRADEPGWYSADGDNDETVHYSLMLDEDDFPPGSRLPLDSVRLAVAEYLATGERPTCVQWQADPW